MTSSSDSNPEASMNESTLPVIRDDLVNADRYGILAICQQSNCVTQSARGLAQHISQQLGVNPYLYRATLGASVPGMVDLVASSRKSIIVANMYAQYNPGKAARSSVPTSPQTGLKTSPQTGLKTSPQTRDALDRPVEDTSEQRLVWFRLCCQKVHLWLRESNIPTIGVPYMIGCGLAGGRWEDYLRVIQETLPEAVLFQIP